MPGPTVEQLSQMSYEDFQEYQRSLAPRLPSPPPPPQGAGQYAPTQWGSTTFDFVCPSGQTCLLKKLRPEELAASGMLDRISRLQGLAEDLVQKASGEMPAKPMDLSKSIMQLDEVFQIILPMAIVQPYVCAVPEDGNRVDGTIYIDSIELMDKVAILNRLVAGLAKYDNFRLEP